METKTKKVYGDVELRVVKVDVPAARITYRLHEKATLLLTYDIRADVFSATVVTPGVTTVFKEPFQTKRAAVKAASRFVMGA